jgi:hypothetical protein
MTPCRMRSWSRWIDRAACSAQADSRRHRGFEWNLMFRAISFSARSGFLERKWYGSQRLPDHYQMTFPRNEPPASRSLTKGMFSRMCSINSLNAGYSWMTFREEKSILRGKPVRSGPKNVPQMHDPWMSRHMSRNFAVFSLSTRNSLKGRFLDQTESSDMFLWAAVWPKT